MAHYIAIYKTKNGIRPGNALHHTPKAVRYYAQQRGNESELLYIAKLDKIDESKENY